MAYVRRGNLGYERGFYLGIIRESVCRWDVRLGCRVARISAVLMCEPIGDCCGELVGDSVCRTETAAAHGFL